MEVEARGRNVNRTLQDSATSSRTPWPMSCWRSLELANMRVDRPAPGTQPSEPQGRAGLPMRKSIPVDEGLLGEETANHGLEGREGHGVELRVEGVLIPLLAEERRALEHGMPAIC
jgi:hypothetical protein